MIIKIKFPSNSSEFLHVENVFPTNHNDSANFRCQQFQCQSARFAHPEGKYWLPFQYR